MGMLGKAKEDNSNQRNEGIIPTENPMFTHPDYAGKDTSSLAEKEPTLDDVVRDLTQLVNSAQKITNKLISITEKLTHTIK